MTLNETERLKQCGAAHDLVGLHALFEPSTDVVAVGMYRCEERVEDAVTWGATARRVVPGQRRRVATKCESMDRTHQTQVQSSGEGEVRMIAEKFPTDTAGLNIVGGRAQQRRVERRSC